MSAICLPSLSNRGEALKAVHRGDPFFLRNTRSPNTHWPLWSSFLLSRICCAPFSSTAKSSPVLPRISSGVYPNIWANRLLMKLYLPSGLARTIPSAAVSMSMRYFCSLSISSSWAFLRSVMSSEKPMMPLTCPFWL